MSGPWHLFKMIHLDWRQFLQVFPVVLNSGLHGVLHHFKGHMVDVGGDVDHSDPKNIQLKVYKIPSCTCLFSGEVTLWLFISS